MKKILVSALALVMLCGCGGEKKEGSTSVCQGSFSGQDAEVTMNFDGDDKLLELKMTMSIDAGSEEAAKLVKDALEEQKDELLGNFGGAGDISITINGSAVDFEYVLDASSSDMKDKFNLDEETKDVLLSQIKQLGFTCK